MDLNPERTREAVRKAQNLRQDRNIFCGQFVAAGPEDVESLALIKKDRRLAVPHHDLRTKLRLARTLLGNSVDHFVLVPPKPLDNLQELRHGRSSDRQV